MYIPRGRMDIPRGRYFKVAGILRGITKVNISNIDFFANFCMWKVPGLYGLPMSCS